MASRGVVAVACRAMAQTDLLKRYLDAGMAFTAMTQARAEAIVKDFVKAGEVQAEQARETANELLERSRQNSEKLAESIRKEIKQQVSNLGLATKDDIARLERKIAAASAPRKSGYARSPRRGSPPSAPPSAPELGREAGLARRRLDAELVRRRLAPDLDEARAHIAAGRVTVGGAPAASAARMVRPTEPVALDPVRSRFVGRGGEKLDAALEQFGIDVKDAPALDVGASTGGFTDCLLQRGAACVVAVDVGYGQLDARLRADPRVDLRERTNVRSLRSAEVVPAPAVAAVDVSFISLRTVLPTVLELVAPDADVVLLVKPQFESTRDEATRGGGVIVEPSIWRRTLGEVAAALQALGATIMGAMISPLVGAEGNVEFLLHAVAAPGRGEPRPAVDLDAVVAAAARGIS